MKYIDSKLFRIQILVQLGFILLFLLFDFSNVIQSIISGVFLCIVGIPHGANDYLFRKNQTNIGLLKFLITYLSIILAYAVLWYLLPTAALILFFVISFHHFGQSNFETKSIWQPSSILWGFFLIVTPVILHFEEAILIFKSMLNFDHTYVIGQYYPTKIILWQVISIAAILLAYLTTVFVYQRKKFTHYSLQVILVLFWYSITPLIFGFIIVFCLWHSLQALTHQKTYFKSVVAKNPKKFYLSMVPFSTIAIAFFILYLYLFDFNIGGAFILLSLITLPHVFISHKLYSVETTI